jgi:hypothetical protein
MPHVIDLNLIRQQREDDLRGKPALVMSETDQECPRRTAHLIVGDTRLAVQAKIDWLNAEVEAFGAGGYATFDNPIRFNGFYYSIGQTVKFEDTPL